jgi:hypothetical protein
VEERADVFALGSILCEMLTGKPAYRGANVEEVYRRAKRGDVAEALESLQGIGADESLTALCRECLSPSREDRPRDADAVAKRLADYQAEVQERLRRAELERAQAEVRVREERKRRRWALAFGVVLLAGTALSIWQAIRATRAETKSQNRLEQIEKANDLLASIFRDLDPRAEEKGGPNLRLQMSQHMEKAAAQLNEAAIGDPLTAARLRYTLGMSLNTLGLAREAISLLDNAYQTQETILGPNDPDTLKSMFQLALAYHATWQPERSVGLLEQCLERQKAQFGPHHPDTLKTLNSLAGIHLANHEIDKVEPFLPNWWRRDPSRTWMIS